MSLKNQAYISACVIFIVAFSQSLFAQQAYTENNKRVIPQPPNVASLLKYNELPINHFNGTADVSVPLMNINEKSVNIPLNLSYHTGGIKVNEEASWVGLGWNLAAGGVIQEIIVGEPDIEYHGFDLSIYNTAPKPNTATVNPSYNTFEGARNIVESGLCYRNGAGEVTPYTYNQVSQSNFEYDLFSFNFAGYSGKCIFPDFTNGVTLDRQNIVFTKQNTPGTSIKAVTPDGTQFFFETIGITTTSRACDRPVKQDLQTRTWYLTKIVYTDKRQVLFSYTKTTSRAMPSLSENWTRTDYGPAYSGFATTSITQSQSPTTMDNYWLNEITFPNGKLTFSSSTRLDMENSRKLDAIRLYKKSDPANPVKEVKFSYDYFQSFDASYGNDWTAVSTIVNNSLCAGQATYLPSADLKRKRLKLLKVEVSDGGTGPLPTYKFNYNATELPVKTSFAQDMWGYYNGANTNSTFIPDYNNLGYWDGNVPYSAFSLSASPANKATRIVSPQYAQASTLTGIVYPTGAYQAIRYESNQISASAVSTQNIVDNFAKVQDMSTGLQQQEFIVPNIGYQIYNPQTGGYYNGNPVKIYINLFCCGYRGSTGCNNGYCLTYNPSFPLKGLYVKLEFFNTQTNQWTLTPDHTYDLSKNVVIDNYGVVNISEGLVPGKYRITANYPDDAPVLNDYSKTIAMIMVTYKDFQTVVTPPKVMVGGLRVKSMITYDNDGAIALQKHVTYKSGRLMVYPLFYRVYSPANNPTLSLRANCDANHSHDDDFINIKDCRYPNSSGYTPGILVNYTQTSLYSNPVVSYSYSANGSLVGYDSVIVTNNQTGKNGKSEYIYNNLPDSYDTYSNIILPGTPSTPDVLNGKLKAEIEYKSVGQVYIPVKRTDYNYASANKEIKWCFKSDYHDRIYYGFIPPGDPLGNNVCAMFPSTSIDLSQLMLYFYPIKLGKVNMVSKAETVYNINGELTSSYTYEYNDKQQLRRTTRVGSEGKSLVQENYYPADYTVTTGIIQEMKSRNMLDYTIETISRTDNTATGGNYQEYYLHDDIVSLNNIYTLKTATMVTVTPSIPGNVKDAKYELRTTQSFDANDNLVQRNTIGGTVNSYLWDYDQTYPVAEINNAVPADAAYTSFESESQGNWSVSSPLRETLASFTGNNAYNLNSGNITKSGLTASKVHILSYWLKTGSVTINGIAGVSGDTRNGWTYYEHRLAGTVTTVTISGTGIIDNLRLWPEGGGISSVTYEPLVGLTSGTDQKGLTQFYEYDSFKRLLNIRDENKAITKNFKYNYTNIFDSSTSFGNTAQSKAFNKSNCAVGTGFGSEVVYSVPAGTYTSIVHIGDANEKAYAEIELNGQYKADTQGSCVPPTCTTPVVYAVVNGTGLNITVMCSGASPYAASQILFVRDALTNNMVGNFTGPITANSIPATVPVKGKTYRFSIMTTGNYCNGVTSDFYDVYIP